MSSKRKSILALRKTCAPWLSYELIKSITHPLLVVFEKFLEVVVSVTAAGEEALKTTADALMPSFAAIRLNRALDSMIAVLSSPAENKLCQFIPFT